MATTRKKRKRRGRESRNRRGGVMMGMRTGFKKAADATLGTGEPVKKKSRKGAWLGTAVTIALLVAAVALLMRRF